MASPTATCATASLLPLLDALSTSPQNALKLTLSVEARAMERRGVRIGDTFAEAFDMHAARVVITARAPVWGLTAARAMTGFATSVIGCKVEAGIEAELTGEQTPDGRPALSVLLSGPAPGGLANRLAERIGQPTLTCPTTAGSDGLRM